MNRLATLPRAIIVHGNYLNRRELDFVAQHRESMHVAFCPRTHEFFKHTEYPLPRMLERRILVGLGTDSRASNPDLALIEEARCVAKAFPQLAAEKLFQMMTIDGARVLGFASNFGTLEPGKTARFATVDCCAEREPLTDILHSASPCRAVRL